MALTSLTQLINIADELRVIDALVMYHASNLSLTQGETIFLKDYILESIIVEGVAGPVIIKEDVYSREVYASVYREITTSLKHSLLSKLDLDQLEMGTKVIRIAILNQVLCVQIDVIDRRPLDLHDVLKPL